MCEVTKCMHHKEGGCMKGLQMLCTRRMEKLGLRVKYHNRKVVSPLSWGSLEME